MDDWFDYMFTILILVFIFFFMFGIFNSASSSAEDYNDFDELTGGETALNLLNTPVEYNGATMLYRDLITLSQDQSQEELEQGFLNVTKELLNPVHGEDGWAINICYQDKGSHGEKCWLYANLNRWTATQKGEDGNLQSEGSITFYDYKNERITLLYRILK